MTATAVPTQTNTTSKNDTNITTDAAAASDRKMSIQQLNWKNGTIPVVLALAPSSLSSPHTPAPLHTLLHRQTFIYCSITKKVLNKFEEHAVACCVPKSSSNGGDKGQNEASRYWLEDVESGLPLRWNLFAGVLFDLFHGDIIQADMHQHLPWKLYVHFTPLPGNQMRCDHGLQTVRRYYLSSLKQALYLQHESSKLAMQMTKQSHDDLWEAIIRSDYGSFWEVTRACDIQTDVHVDRSVSTGENADCAWPHLIPVRLYWNKHPVISRPCHVKRDYDKESGSTEHKNDDVTLGELFKEWLPQIDFEGRNSNVMWKVQGVQVPLDFTVVNLWRNFCHPDLFLYIIVLDR